MTCVHCERGQLFFEFPLVQMDVLVFNAGQREQEVRDLKREIADMLRHIQRLNGELEALLRKVRVTRRVRNQPSPSELLLISIPPSPL